MQTRVTTRGRPLDRHPTQQKTRQRRPQRSSAYRPKCSQTQSFTIEPTTKPKEPPRLTSYTISKNIYHCRDKNNHQCLFLEAIYPIAHALQGITRRSATYLPGKESIWKTISTSQLAQPGTQQYVAYTGRRLESSGRLTSLALVSPFLTGDIYSSLLHSFQGTASDVWTQYK